MTDDLTNILTFPTAHLVPRAQRDYERARRAAARVHAAGGTVMQAAEAAIEAGFNRAATINGFKLRVELAIQLGTGHYAVRARYGARVAQLRGCLLQQAISRVDYWYAKEQKDFVAASALGRGGRLSLTILEELRLMLRMIRRDPLWHQHFKALCGLVDSKNLQAAE